MMQPKPILAFCLLTLALSASHGRVLAAETIVGSWSIDPTACKTDPQGVFVIKPMSISGGISCDFKSVRRNGDTVTWEGICYSPEGDARDGGMTARLDGRKLTLDGSGLAVGPLYRCD
jgi:hypothetical protein